MSGRAPGRPRLLPIGVASLAGLALFFWPFVGGRLPADTPAWALALAALLGLVLVEAGARGLDARALALIAALAAVDTALRFAVPEGIGGFSPLFFLVLCAGYAFGPTFGFLVGAFSILVSAVALGGVGAWVPYQAFAAGWVGVAAGLAGSRRPAGPIGRRDLVLLLGVGAVSGWAFGALMDIQVWVAAYRGNPALGWVPGIAPARALVNFGRFYLLTSAAYDTFRAAGNALMVVLLGLPVLAALARLRARLTFEIVTADASLDLPAR